MPAPKDPEKRAEWIRKNREAHLNKHPSEETLKKMSKSHEGQEPWNKGIPSSEITKQKQSEALKDKPKPPRSKEHCEKISKRNSGEGNPMYNRKHTDESLEKMHNAQLGNKKNLGKHLSLSTRERMSEERRGDKSHTWKGGITPLQRIIRELFKYRDWIKLVFERDNFTCQYCKERGGYLNAHHIKPFYKIVEENNITSVEKSLECKELWDINNGITLCKKCHKKEHFGE